MEGFRAGVETETVRADQLSDEGTLWSLKPWWCQPWSIVLTGVAIPAASWVWPARWWISAPLVLGVLIWWWLFLHVVPKAYRRSQQDG